DGSCAHLGTPMIFTCVRAGRRGALGSIQAPTTDPSGGTATDCHTAAKLAAIWVTVTATRHSHGLRSAPQFHLTVESFRILPFESTSGWSMPWVWLIAAPNGLGTHVQTHRSSTKSRQKDGVLCRVRVMRRYVEYGTRTDTRPPGLFIPRD